MTVPSFEAGPKYISKKMLMQIFTSTYPSSYKYCVNSQLNMQSAYVIPNKTELSKKGVLVLSVVTKVKTRTREKQNYQNGEAPVTWDIEVFVITKMG